MGRITRAGFPAAKEFSGTSFLTTLPAPMTQPSPHGVQGGDDGHVGSKIAVVANFHPGVVLDGEVKVDKAVAPDLGVTAVVEADRAQQGGALPDFSQQLGQDVLSGLAVLLVKGVVVLAEPVALPLFLHQLRGPGLEKLSAENPFLFRHG